MKYYSSYHNNKRFRLLCARGADQRDPPWLIVIDSIIKNSRFIDDQLSIEEGRHVEMFYCGQDFRNFGDLMKKFKDSYISKRV